MRRYLIPCAALIIVTALTCCASAASQGLPADTLEFAGYTWQVRSGSGGPGPNTWDPANVWVDSSGALHLRIDRSGDAWTAAELQTTERIGFGTYQFQLASPIGTLDRNVVLGLFTYPPAEIGPDTTNEIDIEFARWGEQTNPNGNYTVWPAQEGREPSSHTFEFALAGTYTTHRFIWASDSIAFQSLHGHTDTNENEFASWEYRPTSPMQAIPQEPVPLHLNLWLYNGNPPTNGNEVEIIITSLSYTPPRQVFVPIVVR